jgi:tRNA (cmo5U34)-methyltransferase
VSRPKNTTFRVPAEWTFKNPGVAKAFDSHVREQLPWYDLATGIVAHIARSYLPNGGVVIDVGASTGNIGRALANTIAARNGTIVAIDSSPDMAKVYDAPGRLIITDAVDFDFADRRPDLVICFLSMMFVPVAKRVELLEKIKASISIGGAVVVFDKMIPRAGYLGSVAYRLTLAAKYEAGAKPNEIIAKELSISGIQRPMREIELQDFEEVFRFGDFAGFVYEKAPI